jgi:hypothetical protein
MSYCPYVAMIEGASLLTDEMRMDALFSLATLHRAYALLPSVGRALPDASFRAQDQELCGRFTVSGPIRPPLLVGKK